MKTRCRVVKTLTVWCISSLFFATRSTGQESPFKDNPWLYPPQTRPSLELIREANSRRVTQQPVHYSVSDWRHLIDSLWGAGPSTVEKLYIFDNFWGSVDRKWGGFPNTTVRWDSLRTRFRTEIAAGVSRGRFYAIMSRLGFALQEVHTFIRDDGIDSSMNIGEGWYWPVSDLPITFLLGHGLTATGMGLAPMPDSSLFVYRAHPNHPLGIQPGDILLGYDGKRWTENLRMEDSVEFPLASRFSLWGSQPDAFMYTKLVSAASHYTLYDTIGIVRYSTGDTVYLSTQPMAQAPFLWDSLYFTDQIPVPGVPMPDAISGTMCSWGIIEGTTIGYIYSYDWASTAQEILFSQAARELAHTTTGLIIDFRFNLGGHPARAYGGFAELFNKDFSPMMDLAARSDPADHLGFTRTPVSQTWVGSFHPGSHVYDHPIAVLLGPVCLSAGDYNAFFMRFHPMVRFFGKRSNTAYVNGTYDVKRYLTSWLFQVPMGCCYSNFNGEEYLIHKGFDVDEEVWHTREDAANGVDAVVRRAVEWITGLTYAHGIDMGGGFIRRGVDSVVVTAVLANPLGHSVALSAVVASTAGATCDSLRMFNDGTHGDAVAGDSVWTRYVRAPLGEDFYEIALRTDDLTAGTSRRLTAAACFTTAGPVEYVGDTSGAIPQWGKTVPFLLKIRNAGSSVSIPAVTGSIRPLDTAATIVVGRTFSVGNLAPGQTLKSGMVKISFSPWCTGSRYIPLELVFSSGGIEHWKDTMTVFVISSPVAETENGVPLRHQLQQNYPNPFNPVSTIGFSIAESGVVALKVYDMLGREVAVLVNEKKEPGTYEARFDGSGLSSGVYCYRLTVGAFVESRKMVLMK